METIKSNRLKWIFPGTVLWLIAAMSTPSFALNIVLNDTTPGGMSAFALSGFTEAAGRFESRFIDPVTVRLDIGFSPLGAGILGQTGSNTVGFFYSSVRSALISDVISGNDAMAVSNLQAGPNLNFLTSSPTDPLGTLLRDTNNTANNAVLDVSRANARALGLLADTDVAPDASITFNSDFAFDFNPNDGITGGAFDFVGVATHEIGHSLGFISGVDIVDITSGSGPSAPVDLDPFRVFSVLDLYRYSELSVADGNFFVGEPIQDLAVGESNAFVDGILFDGTPYFSIDGGLTNLGLFSTGQFNGDGRQASHWKDNLALGILDPTVASGELLQLSSLDLTAFDVIGWDVTAVPIPSAILLFGTGLIGLGFLKRRNHKTVKG